MTRSLIDRPAILQALRTCRDEFAQGVASIAYERKGVLYSEMLFLKACASLLPVRRVLESGRARGQSTLILARMFPALPLISVEYDRNSPDVPVAAERLAPYPHVSLTFGDATRLLPEQVAAGDIVMIDGPKGHRGVRLALQLLATGKPALVFVHDTTKGSPERRLLERLLPETFYSDDADFAALTHDLDAQAGDDIPAANRYGPESTRNGYGFSLACIPHNPERNYGWLHLLSIVDGLFYRLFRRG
ncbi:MAG: hypothetical protein RIR00_1916 [Pseudomonadota bacterium]|jgi:hypothetical protein